MTHSLPLPLPLAAPASPPGLSPASGASPAPATPPRRNADYRWTPAKAMAFLEALAACGQVAAAARSVGMKRQSAYRLRARVAPVAQAWPLALAAGRARRGLRGPEQGPEQGHGQGGACDSRTSQGDTSQGDGLQGNTTGAAR